MTPLSKLDVRSKSPEDVKVAWRSSVRKNRLGRSDRRLEEHADTFQERVLALPELAGVDCVSVYASRKYEPATTKLIEALHQRGVRVLIPLLGDGLQRGWGEFISTDDLFERAPNRPPEPSGEFLPPTALEDADVVIVPALAADSAGTRLGQGGGWYDRALRDARPGVPLIALVFDDEFHDATARPIPREEHDFPVSIVVTPSAVHRVSA